MAVTFSGMVKDTRPQYSNAWLPISVTDSGIVSCLRLLQPENMFDGIVLRFFGSCTDSRLEHPRMKLLATTRLSGRIIDLSDVLRDNPS
jgi:hypothetical protein